MARTSLLSSHSGLVNNFLLRIVDAARPASGRPVDIDAFDVRGVVGRGRRRHRVTYFARVIAQLQARVKHGIEAPHRQRASVSYGRPAGAGRRTSLGHNRPFDIPA